MTGPTDGGAATSRRVARGVGVVREHGLAATALLAVAVLLGLFLYADAPAVVDALAAVEAWVLLATAGLATAGYLVRFLKWELYLRLLGVDVPLRTSLLVFFSGLMLVVTPGKVGEVWKGWFLRDLEGVPVSTTASAVGAERVTDLLALTALAALGPVRYSRSAPVLVTVVVAFLGGLAVLQWRSLCLGALRRCRGLPLVGDHAASLESLYEGAYALFRPAPLGVALVLSLLAWGLEGIALWLILGGFGVPVEPAFGLFVFGLGSVVGAVSLLPGGLAAAEASMVGILVAGGYDRVVAVGATLVVRVGTLWYGALLGTAVFGGYKLAAGRREGD